MSFNNVQNRTDIEVFIDAILPSWRWKQNVCPKARYQHTVLKGLPSEIQILQAKLLVNLFFFFGTVAVLSHW